MKYTTVLLSSLFLTSMTYAQNGFYLSPSVGAGFSNASKYVAPDPVFNVPGSSAKGPVFSKTAQMGIGYSYKHWRFQTGIQYFQGGYKTDDLIFKPQTDATVPGTATGKEYRFIVNQVGIPLQVGYAIALSPRLTLAPYAGVLTAFSFSGSSRVSNSTEAMKGGLDGGAVNDYGRFTLWGQAGVNLEYKLNNRISLTGGPSFQYRLAGTGNRDTKNLYNINFNLGAKINLGKGGK